MIQVKVHLRNGTVIAFTCEKFTSAQNPFTQEMKAVGWEGAVGEVPQYLNWEEVAAVTTLVDDEVREAESRGG